MSDKHPESVADVARQLAQHLTSLQQAGIEWIGSTPAEDLIVSPTSPRSLPTLHADSTTVQTSLFAAVPGDSAPQGDLEQRRQALQELAKQVSECVRCQGLAATRTQTVFGVGPLDPELCFIGEAPGADEDRMGQPFVGAAGQLLTRIIVACGLKREECYICNILRCRPPGNRNPEPDEAANCQEWLDKTLDIVRPKFICALGNTPGRYLLGLNGGITRTHGRFFEYRGIPVMLTFHPSFLLRTPEKKREAWEDMKGLLIRLGKPIPGGKG